MRTIVYVVKIKETHVLFDYDKISTSKVKLAIEMQEDTDSYNENSSSEVIILPPNNHLEETLISDDEDAESEASHSYEAKLNAKLKDLGLYEDGMTIQQKEELLTVVAVSFKTAEEEKSRRRWYEEYTNAALNFPEDEIEFSFQQSPESELDAKTSNHSGDFGSSPDKRKLFASYDAEKKFNRNNCSTSTGDISNQNDHQNLPSTSQTSNFKTKPRQRKNCSRDGGCSYKLSLEEGNTVTSHSPITILNCKDTSCTTNQQKRLYLENCMSRWKPCLSPKDEPLLRRSSQSAEEQEEPCSSSASSCTKKMQDLMQDFHFALTEEKKSRKSSFHFGKPYHLTRNGQCMRRATKVDSMDIMIGVPDDSEGNKGAPEAADSVDAVAKSQPFSRTSWGAFRYAQLHRDRIDALKSHSAIVNNHTSSTASSSIARFSDQKSVDDYRTLPEIVIEDDTLPDKFDSSAFCRSDSPQEIHCTDSNKTVSEIKLPQFSHLRPDRCRSEFSESDTLKRHSCLPFANCSSVSCVEDDSKTTICFKNENHIDSHQDGNLSDSSSVIDVETIVDDEIEEFVLKRKLLQDSVTSKQTYSNRHKRLKKNISERS